MSEYLLGKDAMAIEKHWRFLYERCSNFGSRGAELRAISAIDLCLWDIFGKKTGQPVWQLLGGEAQEYIPTYNSCGGPAYGTAGRVWPGYGPMGEKGPMNDYYGIINDPIETVKELMDQGYRAFKSWPFDGIAHKAHGTCHATGKEIDESLKPFYQIREVFGNDLEIILDGHGFFQLPIAKRIAKHCEDLDVLWIEDLMRVDSISGLADLRQQTKVPLAVSEMLSGPDDYVRALELHAADYIMIDPTWVGGISQTRNITRLAQFYNVPVVMHDCTGPFTLMSGLQVAKSHTNVPWQESVRAHMHLVYPKLLQSEFACHQGVFTLDDAPGLGIEWQDQYFEKSESYRVSQ